MEKKRKDSRGRVLRKGETFREKEGRYSYEYKDTFGNRKTIYSVDLLKLREREKQIERDISDGLNMYVAGKATLNYLFERYMDTKYNLRENTKVNYKYMYDNYVRNTIGKRLIADIKYSDIVYFYKSLITEKGLELNTVDTIHTVIHPVFSMAVRDDVIRKNPASGVLADIKKESGKNKGIRHALTIDQQRVFMKYMIEEEQFNHWIPIFTILLGTGCRVGDDDDKIRLNQRKPSKYKGLSRFGPEKNLQRINKFMKERPIFYKNLIQMKENFRFYLRCFYCITKVVILQFNSENRTELARNG